MRRVKQPPWILRMHERAAKKREARELPRLRPGGVTHVHGDLSNDGPIRTVWPGQTPGGEE